MSFEKFKLHPILLEAISTIGYEAPTLVQDQTIPVVLDGKDVITSAQTGTGKTAAFAIPILQGLITSQEASKPNKKIKALIVSPTRELAIQIAKNFKSYGKHSNIRSAMIYGGTEIEPQKELLAKGIDILVATPGRLLDLHKQDLLNLDYIRTLVLDEADLMLAMGFIDDVKKIERLCPEDKQTLLFSATIPYRIEQLANQILNNPERIEIGQNDSVASSVHQLLFYVSKRHKISLCLHLLNNTVSGSILIFRRTKFGVDKLYERLKDEGFKVERIHGNRNQNERQKALADFKRNRVNILIATDVAARGIDISELDAVINFDMPNIPETYVHRIGRTGRAGRAGEAFSLCSADEKNYVKSIEQFINDQIPVENNHPFPLDPNAKPIIHKKKGSKHKKGRKSAASKKKKRRWYK
ncbi:DEAD/DEAH box helicase [Psychroserpens sp.]|uniref:DEAD/DEAH box helicase n=1 Tax=Psychroserpens sp. TaxID=2020870 RepID=UPI001B25EC75|nr:DEAD/DEAH box helicase [Psychroserpens sp.]MBO6606869.1 DEAD/DEAH box helicase [Psychroserpens sp.]MBO6630594.1 DEAD/DEAH box helicase [Psychroserpens sp.]MBO6654015.1 DEAD/DEAH box helicase [Psychroserpens sp.]MBO6682699.1 DEAD/DEAH box helicase [Psychroserpens sp.]MBO6750641.1 DEAD/DEAH box helicase [Psychroserpens sp.]